MTMINGDHISIWFRKSEAAALRAVCERHERPISWMIRRAVRELLERIEASEQADRVAAEELARHEESAEEHDLSDPFHIGIL